MSSTSLIIRGCSRVSRLSCDPIRPNYIGLSFKSVWTDSIRSNINPIISGLGDGLRIVNLCLDPTRSYNKKNIIIINKNIIKYKNKNNENLKFFYATNLHILCNYIVHFKENCFKKFVLKFVIFKFMTRLIQLDQVGSG